MGNHLGGGMLSRAGKAAELHALLRAEDVGLVQDAGNELPSLDPPVRSRATPCLRPG